MDACRIHPREHLDHEVLGEADERACPVGGVDRKHQAQVVVGRVDRVERQLQLEDAAPRPRRVEHRVVRLRLLGVVRPVVRHPRQDVLRPRGRLRPQLVQHLVVEVEVAQVLRRDGAHGHGELHEPPVVGVHPRLVPHALPGTLDGGHRVLPVVVGRDAPRGVVEADHACRDARRVEARRVGELPGEVVGALAERGERHVRVHRGGLGHDVHGVGVVEDARPRRDLVHHRPGSPGARGSSGAP